MDYGEVLSRAWKIIWKHKVLWIFGILSGCANSGGGGGGGNYDYTTNGNLPPAIENFFEQTPTELLVALGILAVVFILILVAIAIFLGAIGRIGLYRGTLQAEQGAERLSFGELFRGGLPYFWRIFLLNLLVGLAIVLGVILLVFAGVGFSIATLGIGALCLIPLICLMVPVFLFIGVVVEQANIAIVVENLGILDGLRRGWEVVKNNVGTMIVMWLILGLGVGFIGGMILALPFIVIAGPFFFALLTESQQAIQAGMVASLLCLVAYLPILIVLSGILKSYIESAWTLTFLRLTSRQKTVAEVLPEPLA